MSHPSIQLKYFCSTELHYEPYKGELNVGAGALDCIYGAPRDVASESPLM